MAKQVSMSAAFNISKQNRIKIKGKSKFAPGIVKFQVLGSGANGAPRCLYLFTDHSRLLIFLFFLNPIFKIYIFFIDTCLIVGKELKGWHTNIR